MISSSEPDSDDIKPDVEKKPESRRRKTEPKPEAKKAEMSAKFDDGASEPGKDAESSKGAEPNKDIEAGKALATAGVSPINPFLSAKAEDKVEAPVPPRSFASRMLDYSAHAAIVVGLLGFAWTVSGHVIGKKADAPVATAKAPAKLDEMGELRLANIKMHEEIKSLKASVDALRTTARRDTTAEQVRMLSAGLDNMKSSIGAAKTETNTAIAQLQGKVDKLAPTKLQALADRVVRLEHQSIDTPSTGSIGRTEPSRPDSSRADLARTEAPRSSLNETTRDAPKPPSKPASLANLEPNHAAPADDGKPVISGWVVRDVYQGVALIEGKRGTLEVVPGVSIPGAGVVKSIERHGGGWTVTTSKGQLAYEGGKAQRDQRDYRRAPYGRGGYSYREDY